MDLLCVICGSENGTNGHYLAAFSVDVVFACLPHAHPIGVLAVLAMPVKSYLECWVLAIYSIAS